jgi:hypothetical protein
MPPSDCSTSACHRLRRSRLRHRPLPSFATVQPKRRRRGAKALTPWLVRGHRLRQLRPEHEACDAPSQFRELHRTRQCPAAASEDADAAIGAAGIRDPEVLDETDLERALASGCCSLRRLLRPHYRCNCHTFVRLEMSTGNNERLHTDQSDGGTTPCKRDRNSACRDNRKDSESD